MDKNYCIFMLKEGEMMRTKKRYTLSAILYFLMIGIAVVIDEPWIYWIALAYNALGILWFLVVIHENMDIIEEQNKIIEANKEYEEFMYKLEKKIIKEEEKIEAKEKNMEES